MKMPCGRALQIHNSISLYNSPGMEPPLLQYENLKLYALKPFLRFHVELAAIEWITRVLPISPRPEPAPLLNLEPGRPSPCNSSEECRPFRVSNPARPAK